MATAKEMATMKSNMKSFVKVIEEKEKKEHHPPDMSLMVNKLIKEPYLNLNREKCPLKLADPVDKN
jgi:hypothetical protein